MAERSVTTLRKRISQRIGDMKASANRPSLREQLGEALVDQIASLAAVTAAYYYAERERKI